MISRLFAKLKKKQVKYLILSSLTAYVMGRLGYIIWKMAKIPESGPGHQLYTFWIPLFYFLFALLYFKFYSSDWEEEYDNAIYLDSFSYIGALIFFGPIELAWKQGGDWVWWFSIWYLGLLFLKGIIFLKFLGDISKYLKAYLFKIGILLTAIVIYTSFSRWMISYFYPYRWGLATLIINVVLTTGIFVFVLCLFYKLFQNEHIMKLINQRFGLSIFKSTAIFLIIIIILLTLSINIGKVSDVALIEIPENHIISPSKNVLEIPIKSLSSVSSIEIYSNIEDWKSIPRGKEIGRVSARDLTGNAIDFSLRLGIETSGWTSNSPEVVEAGIGFRGLVVDDFWLYRIGKDIKGYTYRAKFNLPEPQKLQLIKIEMTSSLTLSIEKVLLRKS